MLRQFLIYCRCLLLTGSSARAIRLSTAARSRFPRSRSSRPPTRRDGARRVRGSGGGRCPGRGGGRRAVRGQQRAQLRAGKGSGNPAHPSASAGSRTLPDQPLEAASEDVLDEVRPPSSRSSGVRRGRSRRVRFFPQPRRAERKLRPLLVGLPDRKRAWRDGGRRHGAVRLVSLHRQRSAASNRQFSAVLLRASRLRQPQRSKSSKLKV